MKTDRILTMKECLDEWCILPTHVNPPAGDAHHVPITTQDDVDLKTAEHSCRCDRWGHPCPSCVEKRRPRLCPAADELLL